LEDRGGNHTHFYVEPDSAAYMFYNETGNITYSSTSSITYQWISANTIQFGGLADGTHTIRANLTKADHSELANPEAGDSVTFTIDTSIVEPYVNFILDIPDLSGDEDTIIDINLANYFDTNVGASYNLSTNNSELFTLSVDSSNMGSITPPEDWNGVVTANIVSYYQSISNTSNDFMITIAAVDDAPKLYRDIPDLTWSGPFEKINLDDHFREVDGEEMTFIAKEVASIDVIFDTGDHDVKFRQDGGWTGSVTMIIYANDTADPELDPGLQTASNEFNLTVTSDGGGDDNVAPTISSKDPSTTGVSMGVGQSKTFSVTASDLNNDTLTYSWTVEDIAQNETSNSYTFTATSEGSFGIRVDVSDGVYTSSKSWVLTVTVESTTGDGTNASSGGGESRGDVTIIQKPKSSNLVMIIIIVVAAFSIAGALAYKLIYKKTSKPKTTFEVKSTEEKPGETSSVENEFYQQLRGEELKPIINFIKKYSSKGVKNEKIRTALLKKGWKKNLVDEAFAKV